MNSDVPLSNIHAGCIVIGNCGILICGGSGAGKSSLAFRLIEQAAQKQQFAAMVCDDRALIANINDRLIAQCPPTITGKLEISGLGIVEKPFLPSAVVNLVFDLVDPQTIERMADENMIFLEEIELPLVRIPARSVDRALTIAIAAIDKLCR